MLSLNPTIELVPRISTLSTAEAGISHLAGLSSHILTINPSLAYIADTIWRYEVLSDIVYTTTAP